MTQPLGPVVDTTPRPLPARNPIAGQYVRLEPLHVRHAPDLWGAAQGADESWAYLNYGPFGSEAEMTGLIGRHAVELERMIWAVRPVATGLVSGWISLMNVHAADSSIEVGHVWFAPAMQRTRASTEAVFMLLRLAADELGYRRLAWKCNALNAPSRRAADRLGFSYEGTLRADMVVKGRLRDTAWYSIVGDEWPRARDGMAAWLDPGNFDADGVALRGLAELRVTVVQNWVGTSPGLATAPAGTRAASIACPLPAPVAAVNWPS